MEKTNAPEIKFHYDMLRDDPERIISKLDRALPFFRMYYSKKIKGLEIFYDTPNNLLSSAGLVLSKQFENNGCFFKVRKLSYLPTELRKPSQKFYLAECSGKETPKDYPLQISSAINNAFSNIFTIDLVEVVKQTVAKFEIKIKGELYTLTSGSGMKGQIIFEKVIYKDVQTGRKVKRDGVTVTLPGDPTFKKETEEIFDAIDRKCKELFIYKESRFEIAQRVLRPREQIKGKKLDKKAVKASLQSATQPDEVEKET